VVKGTKHEVWRDDHEQDNLPKVRVHAWLHRFPPSLPPSLPPSFFLLTRSIRSYQLSLPPPLPPSLPPSLPPFFQVKKRDGTIAAIEKKRGFVDYHRNPDPYRDPLDRVFDWGKAGWMDGWMEGGREGGEREWFLQEIYSTSISPFFLLSLPPSRVADYL
jgi:hypothetical protein